MFEIEVSECILFWKFYRRATVYILIIKGYVLKAFYWYLRNYIIDRTRNDKFQ